MGRLYAVFRFYTGLDLLPGSIQTGCSLCQPFLFSIFFISVNQDFKSLYWSITKHSMILDIYRLQHHDLEYSIWILSVALTGEPWDIVEKNIKA